MLIQHITFIIFGVVFVNLVHSATLRPRGVTGVPVLISDQDLRDLKAITGRSAPERDGVNDFTKGRIGNLNAGSFEVFPGSDDRAHPGGHGDEYGPVIAFGDIIMDTPRPPVWTTRKDDTTTTDKATTTTELQTTTTQDVTTTVTDTSTTTTDQPTKSTQEQTTVQTTTTEQATTTEQQTTTTQMPSTTTEQEMTTTTQAPTTTEKQTTTAAPTTTEQQTTTTEAPMTTTHAPTTAIPTTEPATTTQQVTTSTEQMTTTTDTPTTTTAQTTTTEQVATTDSSTVSTATTTTLSPTTTTKATFTIFPPWPVVGDSSESSDDDDDWWGNWWNYDDDMDFGYADDEWYMGDFDGDDDDFGMFSFRAKAAGGALPAAQPGTKTGASNTRALKLAQMIDEKLENMHQNARQWLHMFSDTKLQANRKTIRQLTQINRFVDNAYEKIVKKFLESKK